MTYLSCAPAVPVTRGRVHEIKFVLPATRAPAVLHLLRQRARTDPEHPAARVSSIYFDTPELRFFADKQDSDFHKSKVRLRGYADLATGVPEPDAFLEAKLKEGALRSKARVRLAGAWPELSRARLADPRLAVLVRRLAAEGLSLPGGLAPVLTLRYVRRRFVLPRACLRVALDTDVRVVAAHPRLGAAPPRPLEQAVLELKGSARVLPPELEALSDLGARLASFSKYGECMGRVRAGAAGS